MEADLDLPTKLVVSGEPILVAILFGWCGQLGIPDGPEGFSDISDWGIGHCPDGGGWPT